MNINELRKRMMMGEFGGVGGKGEEEIKQSVNEEIYRITNGSEDDEKEPPNSKSWNEPEENKNGLTAKRFIDFYGLDDPVYDWRTNTKKGKRSRKRFSEFVVNEYKYD